MARPKPLELEAHTRGDTFGPIIFRFPNPAFNLVGAHSKMTFRLKSLEGPVVQTLRSQAGQIEVDAVARTVTVKKFKPSAAGKIYWDHELTFGDGDTLTTNMDVWEIGPDASEND